MSFTLNLRDKLVRYVEHGSLRKSNDSAENAIHPVMVCRKAFFAVTPVGARASTIYYSLIETTKTNNIEQYEYLNFLINQIATVCTVLPWHMK